MVTRTKKIFVGGLSANTVVEDVKQYFEQFGKVSAARGWTVSPTGVGGSSDAATWASDIAVSSRTGSLNFLSGST